LREPYSRGAIKGQKDHRLLMFKTLQQKAPCSLDIARLPVELPIRVEKRDDKIQVRFSCLPDLNLARLHAPLSLLNLSTSLSLTSYSD
jgi:hypothetical protein